MNETALFMFGLQSTELSAEEISYLQHPLSAGVILFTRNFQSKTQITEFIQVIRQQAGQQILIAVDHEGGRVQRFREGFTAIPAMAELGEIHEQNPEKAIEFSTKLGFILAYELAEIGVDFSFSPVLDIQNSISSVIGNRAFHSQVNVLSTLADAFYQGLKQVGMAGVGKHFPGHGNIEADSHLTLPTDTRALADIYHEDILPFKALIDKGIEAIMPAHVLYTACDGMPAGFSNFWLAHVLREKLNFTGCIISDDLDMAGAAAFGDIHARLQLAEKNCDLILLCNEVEHIREAFRHKKVRSNQARQQRLATLQRQPIALNEADYLIAKQTVKSILI